MKKIVLLVLSLSAVYVFADEVTEIDYNVNSSETVKESTDANDGANTSESDFNETTGEESQEWSASFFLNTEIDGHISGDDTDVLSYDGISSDLSAGASISTDLTNDTSISINFLDFLLYGSEDGEISLTSNQIYFGPSFGFTLTEEVLLTAGFDAMFGYAPNSPFSVGFDLFYQLDYEVKESFLSGSVYHNMESGFNVDGSSNYLYNWLIYDIHFGFAKYADKELDLGLFVAGESQITTAFESGDSGTTVFNDFYSGFYYNPFDFFSFDFGFNMISNFELNSSSELESGVSNKIGARVGTSFTVDWFSVGFAYTPLWTQGTSTFNNDFEIMVDIDF